MLKQTYPEPLKPGLIGGTIKRNNLGQFIKGNEYPRPWLRKISDSELKKIECLYWKENYSLSKIAKLYDCNLETVRQFFLKHKIDRRTQTEGTRIVANSPELRKKRSLNASGSKNPHFGKPASHNCGFGRVGIRQDLNQYFRSSWEANIARLLNFYQIPWVYELETFVLGEISYTPDFLVANRVYLEIKGKYLKNASEKIKRFQERFPDKHFIIIDSKIYRQLERVYHLTIPHWEYR